MPYNMFDSVKVCCVYNLVTKNVAIKLYDPVYSTIFLYCWILRVLLTTVGKWWTGQTFGRNTVTMGVWVHYVGQQIWVDESYLFISSSAASGGASYACQMGMTVLRHPTAQVLLAAWVAALAGLAAWYLMWSHVNQVGMLQGIVRRVLFFVFFSPNEDWGRAGRGGAGSCVQMKPTLYTHTPLQMASFPPSSSCTLLYL